MNTIAKQRHSIEKLQGYSTSINQALRTAKREGIYPSFLWVCQQIGCSATFFSNPTNWWTTGLRNRVLRAQKSHEDSHGVAPMGRRRGLNTKQRSKEYKPKLKQAIALRQQTNQRISYTGLAKDLGLSKMALLQDKWAKPLLPIVRAATAPPEEQCSPAAKAVIKHVRSEWDEGLTVEAKDLISALKQYTARGIRAAIQEACDRGLIHAEDHGTFTLYIPKENYENSTTVN